MNRTKEIFFISLLLVTLFMGKVALTFGQTTPLPTQKSGVDSPTPTTESSIQNLKEKIASKVSELTLQDQNLAVGTVSEISSDTLTVKQSDGQDVNIAIDETVTAFYSVATGSKKVIKNQDVKKNDYIIAYGPKVEHTLTANVIYKDQRYAATAGQVVNIDKENFSIDVVTLEKEEITIDTEENTKQQLFDVKKLDLVVSGFSKIKIGDTLHFTYIAPLDKTTKRVSAISMVTLPQEYFVSPSPATEE